MLVIARPSEQREPALRRAREDPRAFAEFYARESEPLLVYFARRTLDAQAAVDLCAETFAQAFAGRDRFRGRTEQEARGWLYAAGDVNGRALLPRMQAVMEVASDA